ncbi:hypothetical protein LCGC14_1068840 [marine sediment metagenome]|uniref:Uncharacterized protein n=1 Tax=marine sediment metagenome TaxID=412755 RepID=A0A0F9MIZ3_9ZZZZ
MPIMKNEEYQKIRPSFKRDIEIKGITYQANAYQPN